MAHWLGPSSFRRFCRGVDRFNRIVPWWFLAGVLGCVFTALLGRQDLLGLVCAFTVWPALILWLFLAGTTILWRFVLQISRGKAGSSPARPLSILLLMGVIACILGAAALLYAILPG